MTPRTALACLAALALSACGSVKAPHFNAPHIRAPRLHAPRLRVVRERPAAPWALQIGGPGGDSLVLPRQGGGDLLRFTCRGRPAELYVASDALKPSAEVWLEIGERRFGMLGRKDETRLAATRPLPDAFPAALRGGAPVTLRGFKEQAGPYKAPDAQAVATFLAACNRRGG